jgi:hypothetical protein
MSEPIKTIVFVAVGALALGAAFFIDRPAASVDHESKIGESLTGDFEVDAPKRLRVIKFDPATAETKQFEVASIDGVWRIPSKDNYPADATRQMASAANALIDRKILRVAAQTADAHEELGVVDPLSEKLNSGSQGVGTRVIMKNGNGDDLVDLIVGNKVKDADGQRYVRKANQDVVYVVELNPDNLSTSFSDWIEPDLLKLSPFDIRRVFINDYSADLGFGMTADGRIAPHVSWDRRNEFTLAYDNKDSKWNLADIKKYDKSQRAMVPGKLADDEELNQDKLNEMRNALDDLQIVDIARKPSGLSGDLKAGADFLAQSNKETFQDLIAKGFSPVPLKEGAAPEILSSEGEVVCTLRDGVEYVLRFGQLQVQTESAGDSTEPSEPGRPGPGETKSGETASAADGKTAKADEQSKDDAQQADAKKDEPKKDSDAKNLRRYLFVMARFNQDIIEKPKLKEVPATPTSDKPAEAPAASSPAAGGDDPAAANNQEPTDESNPTPGETASAADGETAKADEQSKDDAKQDDAKKEESKQEADAKPADNAKGAEGDANKKAEADKAAADRKAIEEENQRAQDEYNRSVEGGQKKVKELNERFGDWYYVISNDVYKKIHLTRADIVKKKSKPEGDKATAANAAPNPLAGLPNLPGAEQKPAESSAPSEPGRPGPDIPSETAPADEQSTPEAPEKDAPQADQPQPEAPAAEAKPVGEPSPTDASQ